MTNVINMKKEKVHKIEKQFDYIIIDGKPYQPKQVNGKTTFKPVNKRVVDERAKKVKEIAKALKDGLDAEKVLAETLMKIDVEDLDQLYNMVKSKRKYKPKTRKHHCVDMTYGNFIIPIVE